MGLTDPEDLIPGLIIAVSLLGFLGGLTLYISSLDGIPVFSDIIEIIHAGFTWLGNFLTPWLNFEATIIGMIIEVLIVIIMIVIIVQVGY